MTPTVPQTGDGETTVANIPAKAAAGESSKPQGEARPVTAMEAATLEQATVEKAAEALRPNEPASVPRSTDPAVAPAGERPAAPQAMTPMRLVADATGGSASSPSPLPEQNIEAVVASVRSGIAGGKQHHAMTIRLDPPQLGSMRVNVQMVDGQLVASFNTTSEVAQRLVQQSLPQLRLGLEQAGFQIDRLEVSRTHSDSQSNLFQQGGDGESREQMQQHQRQQHRRETLIRLWRSGWFDDGVNLVA